MANKGQPEVTKIDHVAEAQKWHEKALSTQVEAWPEKAPSYQESAQLHATLAVAEQLRIANIIALQSGHLNQALATAEHKAQMHNAGDAERVVEDILRTLGLWQTYDATQQSDS